MLDFHKLHSAFTELEKSETVLHHLASKGVIITLRGNFDQVEIAFENVDGTAECVLLKEIAKAFEAYRSTALRALTYELDRQLRPVNVPGFFTKP